MIDARLSKITKLLRKKQQLALKKFPVLKYIISPLAVWILASVLVCLLFLFTRLYKIDTGLFFFNDMGRDSFVLWNWEDTGKPPLLGPQNSAVPFNQSALYFYWLMPIFWLTHGSAFAAGWTVILSYVAVFATTLWLTRSKIWLRWATVLIAFLVCIHPQFITQNRFVWNPSFVAPFFLVGVGAAIHFAQKPTWKNAWLFAIPTALAVAFSYSVIPAVVALCVVAIIVLRQKSLPAAAALAISGAVLHLPTIVFELRHNFLLTNALINGEAPPQMFISVEEKLRSVGYYILAAPTVHLQLLFFFMMVVAMGANLWLIHRTKKQERDTYFLWSFATLVLTMVLSFVIPIAIHSHYVFGIVSLGFFTFATMRFMPSAVVIIAACLFWLSPVWWTAHFAPAPRSVDSMEQCFTHICANFTEPTFVSTNSRYHPFHNGPEFRFWMAKHGCDVKVIETEPTASSYMAVVADNSVYEHGKTAYNELTEFGNSAEVQQLLCPDNVRVHLLKRK